MILQTNPEATGRKTKYPPPLFLLTEERNKDWHLEKKVAKSLRELRCS